MTLPFCPQCRPHRPHMQHSHILPHMSENALWRIRVFHAPAPMFTPSFGPISPHISANACLRFFLFFCAHLIVPEEPGACAAGHFHRSELEWRGSCTLGLDVGDARAHTREALDPPTLNLVHSGRSSFFLGRRTLRSAFLEPADQISLQEKKSVHIGR